MTRPDHGDPQACRRQSAGKPQILPSYNGSTDPSPTANYFNYKVYIEVSTDYVLTRLGI
jgi:hypothetical protein